jgi:hypothetical protein
VAYTHIHQWANGKNSGKSDDDSGPEWKAHLVGCDSNLQTQFFCWGQRESERGSGGATSGGRFTNSQEDRRAQKGDTVGTVQLMHREVRLSPTLAGTMMIDGERAPLSTGPGSAAVSDFSTLRGTSALHVEVPQYCKLDTVT